MKGRNPKPRVLISSAQRAVRVDRKRLTRLVEFVAAAEGQRLGQIDLAVVGKGEIISHNRRWLGHVGPTDVISFDLSEAGEGLSGQLIVCGDVAAEQARLRGLPVQEELMLYVVHGLLHLMGYDDLAIRAAAKMHAREEELLKEFIASGRAAGIRNPQSAFAKASADRSATRKRGA
jgi:probable rRNA maturation factor